MHEQGESSIRSRQIVFSSAHSRLFSQLQAAFRNQYNIDIELVEDEEASGQARPEKKGLLKPSDFIKQQAI